MKVADFEQETLEAKLPFSAKLSNGVILTRSLLPVNVRNIGYDENSGSPPTLALQLDFRPEDVADSVKKAEWYPLHTLK